MTEPQTPPRVDLRRRLLLGGGVVVLAGVALFGTRWFNTGAEIGERALSVTDAHAAATSGQVLLVDIRRPGEWARTGIGEGAHPLDMRRPDFVTELLALRGNRDVPVALICARGVRSRNLTAALTEAGLTDIIDVPEGMLGSGAGPGWLATGLPVSPFVADSTG